MRKIIVLLFLFQISIGFAEVSTEQFFTKTNTFLQKYVDGGKVNYKMVKSNVAELTVLTNYIASIPLDSLSSETKKAYLINVYNLSVIQQVVSNYPIKSPMDIAGFFESTKFNVGGEKMTLNHIENEILRKEYKDPRFHFVLVCGALGCPVIANYAYNVSELESQLEMQTKLALNNEKFVYENDKGVHLSEIFTWYSSDFGGNEAATLAYINGYRTTPFSTTKKVLNYPYDWTLNENALVLIETNPDSIDSVVTLLYTPDINLQTYTAGSLLGKGKFDFTTFNTIYTESRSNWLGVDYSGTRSTFFTSSWQVLYGVSKNKRINAGLEVNFKSSATSSDSTFSSTFNAFSFKNNDSTRVGIANVGLKIKLAPFKGVNDFSIQSTLTIPTVKHPEGYTNPDGSGNGNLYWADWDRITSWTQFFYVKSFKKFQVFTEADLLFRIRRTKEQITHLDLPLTLIFSYFPTSKITVYGIGQHNMRYTDNIHPDLATDWVIPMNYSTVGAGVKYQPVSNITIELLYTNFIRGKNTGLGNTFNIGFKFLTK